MSQSVPGILWLDSERKSQNPKAKKYPNKKRIVSQVLKVMALFRNKVGFMPTVVHLNPTVYEGYVRRGGDTHIRGVEIKPSSVCGGYPDYYYACHEQLNKIDLLNGTKLGGKLYKLRSTSQIPIRRP